MLHAVWITPWSQAYFNPLLGGSKAAEQAILVGWGEGLELAGERIRQREAPRCDATIAVMYSNITSAFPCGTTTADASLADYLVLYVNHRQRLPGESLTNLRQRGQLVGVVAIRGIDYAEIYDLRAAARADPAGSAAMAGAPAPHR
jgi:hypothetical protein